MTTELFGPDAPDWLNLDNDERTTCVKTGHQRSVWHVALPDCDVYAKVFTGRGILDQFKAWCGLANGQREWRNAVSATAKGAPLATPLAIGVRHAEPTTVVYLCRAFVDGTTLPKAWSESADVAQSRQTQNRLIDAIATLYAKGHGAGLCHLDGHPNNVLVRKNDSGGFEAVFIDLAWARVKKHALETSAAAASLAQLDHFFRRVATKTQRLRFLHGYHAERVSNEVRRSVTDRLRCLLDTIHTAHDHHTKRLAARRDRRLGKNGKYFSRITLGRGWSGMFVLKHPRRHVFDLGDTENRTVADWQTLMAPVASDLERAPSATGHAEAPPGLALNVKRPTDLSQRIAWTIWGSPSYRAFVETHRCRHRDEPAPLILGYMEHRRFGLIDLAMTVNPTQP